jgi:hypothetical protein
MTARDFITITIPNPYKMNDEPSQVSTNVPQAAAEEAPALTVLPDQSTGNPYQSVKEPLPPAMESMMMAAAMCDHPGPFDITTDVRRHVHDNSVPRKVTFEATFTVRCPKCRLPMCFENVPVPGPKDEYKGPRSDAIGLTLTVALRPGREAFEHFMETVGKTSPLAPIATQPEATVPAKPESLLRKGMRKVSEALNLQPGTRPIDLDGNPINPGGALETPD